MVISAGVVEASMRLISATIRMYAMIASKCDGGFIDLRYSGPSKICSQGKRSAEIFGNG
jgi:hypothetical protein